MKLNYIGRNKPHAKDKTVNGKYIRGKRFYTSVDMAIVKHDIAIHNSMINRKEVEKKGTYLIKECGCGGEGCFLHIELK